MEENKIETRTLEELLKYLREKNNWSYYDVIEKLHEKSVIIDEKQLKKWEIGLEYPNADMIYKLSELYMIPSTTFITAKNNSFNKGLESVHMIIIKWFCYITGVSLKVAYIGSYIILGLALIWSFMFFLGCAGMV